ncbi:hypothetical protein ACWFMI_23680 [Nocardiopsis terrae]|uniref:hypothetical protein n=1 Tax=Streptomyces sp. NPDC057554 TaxID=3350538 RepID=UPI0036A9DCAC
MTPTTAGAVLAIATAALDQHTPATHRRPARRCSHPQPELPGPHLDQWEDTHPENLGVSPPWDEHRAGMRQCSTEEITVCVGCCYSTDRPVEWPCDVYEHLAQALDAYKEKSQQ